MFTIFHAVICFSHAQRSSVKLVVTVSGSHSLASVYLYPEQSLWRVTLSHDIDHKDKFRMFGLELSLSEQGTILIPKYYNGNAILLLMCPLQLDTIASSRFLVVREYRLSLQVVDPSWLLFVCNRISVVCEWGQLYSQVVGQTARWIITERLFSFLVWLLLWMEAVILQ